MFACKYLYDDFVYGQNIRQCIRSNATLNKKGNLYIFKIIKKEYFWDWIDSNIWLKWSLFSQNFNRGTTISSPTSRLGRAYICRLERQRGWGTQHQKEDTSGFQLFNARVASYDNDLGQQYPTILKLKLLMGYKLNLHLWLTRELKLTQMIIQGISHF